MNLKPDGLAGAPPKPSLELQQSESPLFGSSATFVEALYEQYLVDPNQVDDRWRRYFDDLQGPGPKDVRHAPIIDRLVEAARRGQAGRAEVGEDGGEKHYRVLRMINAYRARGHLRADLDPLSLSRRPDVPDLDPSFYEFRAEDLDRVFNTGSLAVDKALPLREVVAFLNRTYAGKIGVEYRHISDIRQRLWIQERMERAGGQFGFSGDEKREILRQLTAAEGLEKYLHTKYVGQKRFSLEGAESLIALLHDLVYRSGSHGIRELVIGMAHRGRLNVLINILGKSPRELFEEFEGKHGSDDPTRSGDVKYHLGFSSDIETPSGTVHLAMGFNPSHLEIIDPVVVGSARARQQRRGDYSHSEVAPILIHGDAAFAGQGVVMELFNMSQARGFNVGGTLHVIVNNQIGFTTSNPLDARSTLYCTEVAKMVQAPIFHVNGDDPEAVVFCARMAADFRETFKKDVVIDLVCYRRLGHNEADEPAATQPLMYRKIRSMDTVRTLYANVLESEGVIEADDSQQMVADYREALDRGEPVREAHHGPFDSKFMVDWSPYLNGDLSQHVETRLPLPELQSVGQALVTLPEGLELHPRVRKIIDDREKMLEGQLAVDWGMAEALACGSLLREGYTLRLVGQDAGRGTFFHRHAALHDQKTGDVFVPLTQLVDEPHSATVIDSLLSEEAVLAFEYGYASSEPGALVIWEAQFGDFVNGAQVVIDQFISSGEAKWGRLCGLVMFLPHGYEGQGPEHSSARLERFLQLCAQNNMVVCMPTTPGQMFHLLRRQMLQRTRKPLIVMTPKSMLRNKASTSKLKVLTDGSFQRIVPDRVVEDRESVNRVILCSGKVYYDLIAEREARQAAIPIIRVEQLFPFPRESLKRQLARYPASRELVWCQEEPINQGAWYQIKHHLQYCQSDQHRLLYTGRGRSPAPAVGLYSTHVAQQTALVDEALTPGKGIELSIE